MRRRAIAIFVLFACCSPQQGAPEDVVLPEYEPDVTGLIEVWDGPVGLNVFGREYGSNSDIRRLLLPDYSEGAVFIIGGIYAQRISADGAKLWGETGLDARGENGGGWIDRYKSMEVGGIPDGEGGAMILRVWEHLGDLFIMGQRIFPDGSLLFERGESGVHGPYESIDAPLVLLGNSLLLGDRLLLNVSIVGDYLFENGFRSICPFFVDEFFLNPPAELPCLGAGVIPVMFRTDEDNILYITGSDIVQEADGPVLDDDPSKVDVRYNVLDGNLASLTGGEAVVMGDRPRGTWGYFAWMSSATGVEYDRPSNAVYYFVPYALFEETVYPILMFDISGTNLVYSWKYEDGVYWGEQFDVERWIVVSQGIASIKGDGMGGIYVASVTFELDGDVPEVERCNERVNGCHVRLRIQRLGPDGIGIYDDDATTVEKYPYGVISNPEFGDYDINWHPRPVFARSIDHEPDGSAVYFWMKPLVNEGTIYPDNVAYDYGYYLCSQKATPETPASWGDGGCMIVAQILAKYWVDNVPWFEAIDDGDGGAILVYNDHIYGIGAEENTGWIRAQRISSDGQLMWSDTAP